MDNDEVPERRKLSGNWILLLILSLLIGGVLYNVWNLIEMLTGPILAP
ncbi:MAG TPA: hypothetical protein G4N94_05435 [Caldilineae bacterium]|nr:hypothetical protein [Caldilineae bacterium]